MLFSAYNYTASLFSEKGKITPYFLASASVMAEFKMISEVLIKEELVESKSDGVNINVCDPLFILQCHNTLLEEQNEKDVDKLKVDKEDPLLLDSQCNTSVESKLNGLNDLSEDTNTVLTNYKSDSDFEEHSSSSENSYHKFKIKTEQDDDCDSLSDEDTSFDKNHKLYEPPGKDSKDSKKKNYKNNEKPFECPLCHKWFKTSSAMNGHVAKGHRTTLGDKFICHVCGSPGSSRASLKRHLIRTHKITNVDHPELLTKKCLHCGIGFASHQMMYEHIRSSHEELLKLYHHCQWCPALMKAKASLIRHVRRAHPGNEDYYSSNVSCTICSEDLSNIPMLQRHMKKEHPNDIRHKCSSCPATFKFPYMLTKHKILHEDPAKYLEYRKKRKYSVTCELCGRTFDSKPRLRNHIKNIHTNPSPSQTKVYTCRLCNSAFPTAKQNNRHYRRVHRPQRQKVHCGKCNLTFGTPQECNEHRASHPNTCEICQKQFLRRDSLREHLLIHSAPRHQCPHCDKKFTQRSNLKRHIRVHTGEKPYRCPYCSRSFSDKSACNSHTRVHTGYERSICTVCGASFSKKQRLNYHMRLHSGQGLMHCPLCTRSCTTSYALRKHIESHLVPLTKALKSLGFGPLLQSDHCFVQNALQAVTQATLKRSFEESYSETAIYENDTKEFNSNLSNKETNRTNFENEITFPDASVKVEREESNSTEAVQGLGTDKTNSGELNIDDNLNSDCSATKFNLTKFLQGILEKESSKIRRKRKLHSSSKDRQNHDKIIFPTNINDEEHDESVNEEEEEEELPETIGDELVKQCLEIVMKDEIIKGEDDDFEYDRENSEIENGGDSDCDGTSNKNFFIDSLNLTFDKNLDSESSRNIISSFSKNEELNFKKEEFIGLSNTGVQGIPKLKISRISCKENDDLDTGIFIAEIIENS